MKEFQVITKLNCAKCVKLKKWLNREEINYEEWSLEDQKIIDKLLEDQKFLDKFCDTEGCIAYTPIIRIQNTGEYYYENLFGLKGMDVEYIKKLLDI
jgi:glutaredoxin